MKKVLFSVFCFFLSTPIFSQIIADHTVIDDFDYIPEYYIDEVKKMQLGYIGESHAAGFRTALTLLEEIGRASCRERV